MNYIGILLLILLLFGIFILYVFIEDVYTSNDANIKSREVIMTNNYSLVSIKRYLIFGFIKTENVEVIEMGKPYVLYYTNEDGYIESEVVRLHKFKENFAEFRIANTADIFTIALKDILKIRRK